MAVSITQSWKALCYSHQRKTQFRADLGYSGAGLFYQGQQLGQELVQVQKGSREHQTGCPWQDVLLNWVCYF